VGDAGQPTPIPQIRRGRDSLTGVGDKPITSAVDLLEEKPLSASATARATRPTSGAPTSPPSSSPTVGGRSSSPTSTPIPARNWRCCGASTGREVRY